MYFVYTASILTQHFSSLEDSENIIPRVAHDLMITNTRYLRLLLDFIEARARYDEETGRGGGWTGSRLPTYHTKGSLGLVDIAGCIITLIRFVVAIKGSIYDYGSHM